MSREGKIIAAEKQTAQFVQSLRESTYTQLQLSRGIYWGYRGDNGKDRGSVVVDS